MKEHRAASRDWEARTNAFKVIDKAAESGRLHDFLPRDFDKVVRLFYEHVDDKHHRVVRSCFECLSKVVAPADGLLVDRLASQLLEAVVLRLRDFRPLAIRDAAHRVFVTLTQVRGPGMLLSDLLKQLNGSMGSIPKLQGAALSAIAQLCDQLSDAEKR